MIIVARLLHPQKWKDSRLHSMEEWLGKLKELAEMAKLSSLIRERCIGDWKPLMDVLHKNKIINL